ncbi:MAG: nucleotide exchange factor GrpE [Clostridia bacterium]|nr:nucleotide exchange factor GrpE [Clostridia bacterium]
MASKKPKDQKAPQEEPLTPDAPAAEETAEAGSAPQEDKAAALEAELAAAKEAHIRTLAEYDNYRKRTTREKESLYGDAKAAALSELLPVLDNFERALAAPDADAESLKKGMEMIFTGFRETLKKLGVEAFGEPGDPFDPNIHNAVMHLEDDALGENVIAAVFSKGYKLGDRILRPAMVQVAN